MTSVAKIEPELHVTAWNGKPITKSGIYSGVSMEAYHGGALCAGPSISSSGLRTIFSESEMDYWIHSPLNPRRIVPDDSPAFSVGRAAHHLFLGQADFEREFVVRPDELDGKPWQGNRTVCKEWVADHRAAGMTVLSAEEFETIRGIGGFLPWQQDLEDSGLVNNRMVREGLLNGLIEHTIAFQDPDTGVWLLSRPDAIPTDGTYAGDLKTTRGGVHDHELRRAIEDYRYDMQGALMRRCLRGAAELDLDAFALVFVSKKRPHAVRIKELYAPDLDAADRDITTALRTFARCLKSNKWPAPGGTSSDATFSGLGKWAREGADARRSELEQEHAA